MKNERRFPQLRIGDWFHLKQTSEDQFYLKVGDAGIIVDLPGDDEMPTVVITRGEYGTICGETREMK